MGFCALITKFLDRFRDTRVFELVSIETGIGSCYIRYTVDGVEHETNGNAYGFRNVNNTTSNREWQYLIKWWEEHNKRPHEGAPTPTADVSATVTEKPPLDMSTIFKMEEGDERHAAMVDYYRWKRRKDAADYDRLGYEPCREEGCEQRVSGIAAVCTKHMNKILWSHYDSMVGNGCSPSEALGSMSKIRSDVGR